jgi:hypothetical protein
MKLKPLPPGTIDRETTASGHAIAGETTMSTEQSAKDAELLRKVQAQLDQALEDSFPASDPISIVTSQTEEDWTEEEAVAHMPVPPPLIP